VQIITGILLGPGILGSVFPNYYTFVFTQPVVQSLNGIAWWAVMIFVWIAGIELDLKKAWAYRRESCITAGLAFATPLLFGSIVAAGMLMYEGWAGPKAMAWQFVLGVGMACAVTALPILILLMDKGIITSETFTALLLMAIVSTMLTVPVVSAKRERMKSIVSQSV
jgi:Kef-type K+ transport system membrane component KefB